LCIPRQLAGRVFRFNLFFGQKPQKRIFTSTPNANSTAILAKNVQNNSSFLLFLVIKGNELGRLPQSKNP